MEDGVNLMEHLTVFKGLLINLGELISRLRKKIRHFYFLPHFLILLST